MSALQRLKVSGNRRFLVHDDGSPFFWLGDTAWELFHKLNREEVAAYLRNRANKGFNVIQAVALAELEGLTTPNTYGRFPLKKNESGAFDPELPDLDDGDTSYSYWDHVDDTIRTAAELGLYIALLPTWGDKYNLMWGKGPEIFTKNNAYTFGKWLGERYRDATNIIWVLGGDRPLHTRKHIEIVHAMAEGVREGDEGSHLMTFHPMGNQSSSIHVHEEEWLDFNMIQTGHQLANRNSYVKVEEDYRRTPVKPVIDAEPCYEDHPVSFKSENGFFDPHDVRRAAYYAILSGACGHTYGHHSIWSMTKEPTDYFIMTWQDALDRPGANQMKHVKALMQSRPFLELVPDQSLIAANKPGVNYMTAARGSSYAYIYIPHGLRAEIELGKLSGRMVAASWYDPRTGTYLEAGSYANEGVATFSPPSSGRNDDWVLVLDSK